MRIGSGGVRPQARGYHLRQFLSGVGIMAYQKPSFVG